MEWELMDCSWTETYNPLLVNSTISLLIEEPAELTHSLHSITWIEKNFINNYKRLILFVIHSFINCNNFI